MKATTKRCFKCNRYKARHLFNRNNARPDKLQTQCRSCQKKSSAETYKISHKVMIKQTKIAKSKRRAILQSYVAEYKANNPCVEKGCKNNDIRGLDFDHVRGRKISDVSLMIQEGVPLIKLQKEIGKCVVRCAYHHKIRTSKKNKDYLHKYVRTNSRSK